MEHAQYCINCHSGRCDKNDRFGGADGALQCLQKGYAQLAVLPRFFYEDAKNKVFLEVDKAKLYNWNGMI